MASPPPEPAGSGAEFSTSLAPTHGAWAAIPCGTAVQRDPRWAARCVGRVALAQNPVPGPPERTPCATGGARGCGAVPSLLPALPPPSHRGRSIRSLLFLYPAGTSSSFLPPEALRCGGLYLSPPACSSSGGRKRAENSGDGRGAARIGSAGGSGGSRQRAGCCEPGTRVPWVPWDPAPRQPRGQKHLIRDRVSRLEAAPGVPEGPIRNLSCEGGLRLAARKYFQARKAPP